MVMRVRTMRNVSMPEHSTQKNALDVDGFGEARALDAAALDALAAAQIRKDEERDERRRILRGAAFAADARLHQAQREQRVRPAGTRVHGRGCAALGALAVQQQRLQVCGVAHAHRGGAACERGGSDAAPCAHARRRR